MSDDEKKLQNEILPDPSQAETDLTAGGPRRRTIEHLKRILPKLDAMVIEGLMTMERVRVIKYAPF